MRDRPTYPFTVELDARLNVHIIPLPIDPHTKDAACPCQPTLSDPDYFTTHTTFTHHELSA